MEIRYDILNVHTTSKDIILYVETTMQVKQLSDFLMGGKTLIELYAEPVAPLIKHGGSFYAQVFIKQTKIKKSRLMSIGRAMAQIEEQYFLKLYFLK